MTANDSDVSDGDTLTGSQLVRVYGKNLTAPFVTLTFGEVEFTPLAQGEGYIEFILGDNGTATINVDGSRFMSFDIEGIVVPDSLPTNMAMQQRNNNLSEYANPLQVSGVNCIQYPYIRSESYPKFRLSIGASSAPFTDLDDFVCEGGEIDRLEADQSYSIRMFISVPESNVSPCYVTYKGFIVAVFNYTTE